jgi:hypothetical protein
MKITRYPILIIVGVLVVVVVLVLVACARTQSPWRSEDHELARIASGGALHISNAGTHGGNRSCVDSCPSVTKDVSFAQGSWQSIAADLSKALRDAGYVLAPDALHVTNGSGGIVTSPFRCVAPNTFSGSTINWQCVWSANGPQYTASGTVEFRGDTRPSPVFQQGTQQVAAGMPDLTRYVLATITLLARN